MTRRDLTLEAGTYVVFSEGEYSDYGYRGFYKVVGDHSDQEVRDVALQLLETKAKDETNNWWYMQDQFIVELLNRGWIEHMEEPKEIHLGSYGDLEVHL